MENKYYVYVYLDPRKPGEFKYEDLKFDYEPIYIGKGCNYRCRTHLWTDKTRKNPYLTGKIKNIKEKLNIEPIILKIKEDLTNKDACEYEKLLIRLIGRSDLEKGPLTNFTDGGEGGSGMKRKPWSKETREKIMAIRKIKPPRLGKHNSEFQKQTVSRNFKNKPKSKDHKKALSEARKKLNLKGVKLSEYHINRIKEGKANRPKSIRVKNLLNDLIGEYPTISAAFKDLKICTGRVRKELKTNKISITEKYIFEKI